MELGDLAHEMIHPVRAGGEGHLFLRLGRIPLGLGEELCANEKNPALSTDRELTGTSTIGPYPARPVPDLAPHDPPRQADACRWAIGRPILPNGYRCGSRGDGPGRSSRQEQPRRWREEVHHHEVTSAHSFPFRGSRETPAASVATSARTSPARHLACRTKRGPAATPRPSERSAGPASPSQHVEA